MPNLMIGPGGNLLLTPDRLLAEGSACCCNMSCPDLLRFWTVQLSDFLYAPNGDNYAFAIYPDPHGRIGCTAPNTPPIGPGGPYSVRDYLAMNGTRTVDLTWLGPGFGYRGGFDGVVLPAYHGHSLQSPEPSINGPFECRFQLDIPDVCEEVGPFDVLITAFASAKGFHQVFGTLTSFTAARWQATIHVPAGQKLAQMGSLTIPPVLQLGLPAYEYTYVNSGPPFLDPCVLSMPVVQAPTLVITPA